MAGIGALCGCPLLDYGNVIILEPESDYLLIVAGLATVFVQAGDL
jgi:septal ring factor EnvC (AmiA/AmiB activator)